MGDGIERLRTALRRLDRETLAVLLVWSCLLVQPIGRLVELPVVVMALGGVYLLVRRWPEIRDDAATRWYATAFLLAWIPVVVSLVDAVNAEATLRIVVNHLRFAFGGVFIVYALGSPRAHDRFLALCAWVLLAWVADGLVQVLIGRDVFGFAAPPGRINALFGEEGLAYGILLGVLCPLLWEHATRRWARWQVGAVVLATLAAVLVAGARSAWINVAVIAFAYGIVLWRRRRRFPASLLAGAVVGAALVVAILWSGSDRFSSRLENAIGALTGDTPVMEDAIGHRLWIWRGAVNMIEDNLGTGVGAGGFRYAFARYADANDPFVNADPPINPYHSHQLWLQVSSETGMVGVVGLLALLVLLAALAARAPPAARRLMLPYGLCLVAAYFPFNTHMAIYSSFWSQIVWWLIALYCAAYGAGRTGDGVRG